MSYSTVRITDWKYLKMISGTILIKLQICFVELASNRGFGQSFVGLLVTITSGTYLRYYAITEAL